MKIVQINATCGIGSTGKICTGISGLLNREQIENYILYSFLGDGSPDGISCGSKPYIKVQALKTRLFDNYGFNSGLATRKMLAELDRINPDIVHLHNVHDHMCNLEMLLDYLKRHRVKVIWTFHDCWAFTGKCEHFTMAGCDSWRGDCSHCLQRYEKNWFFDRSAELLERKKQAVAGLDLTIVTPSRWLADLTKESFLGEYPIKVIHNGIDLTVFRPRASDLRRKYGIENKFLLLGVAFDWGRRKGLDVFVELSRRLDERYQIVLIGTNPEIDRQLPPNIISIHRTNNQQELAEIYTAADVFLNPTREEVLGMVNLEALACGTPVITFDTGGSPETMDGSCGLAVPCDDVDAMEAELRRVCRTRPFLRADCLKRAAQFDMNDRLKEYIDLYQDVSFTAAGH